VSEEVKRVSIPENHVEFCRALARVCKQHGIASFFGRYRPDWQDPWRDVIQMNWQQGRHGEEADRISITSEVQINTRIDGKVEE
jgi:hypothetical protein